MSLKEDIKKFMEQFHEQVPEEIRKVMQDEAERLAQSGITDKSLKVGDKVPTFALPNIEGKSISSVDLLARGPLVISFYRGGWWPYCNLELRALQLVFSEIESLGANLVAISPQVPGKSVSTAEENKLTFEVLSDVGNKVARQFGLVFTLSERLRPIYKKFGVDVPAANGDDSYELPITATYVIDVNGTIVHAFVDTDYSERLEPAEVVEIVRKTTING